MLRTVLKKCLLVLLLATSANAGASPAMSTSQAVREASQASLSEWVEFLKLPNVNAGSDEPLRANAEWIADRMIRRGLAARLLEADGPPAVFGEWRTSVPHAPTILFYAHMDGQAVKPAEWAQASPFEPVLKTLNAQGIWQVLPMSRLAEARPDWRLFARSAADDKAPIMMLLAALDALRMEGRQAAVNVKILLDPAEESGSPGLGETIARNRSLLAADAIVVLDGPMHRSGRPTIVYGHRGAAVLTLTVLGPRKELHSGHFGNFVPNPAQALAGLIAAFKDANGRVLIPGFYEGVDLSPSVRNALASVPDDEAAMLRQLGIARAERVGSNYEEALNYPSLNITALQAGDPGQGRTIVPASAIAQFDIRTVAGTPGARQIALVRDFVAQQGFHLVNGTPTEEERLLYPKLAAVDGKTLAAALATPLDAAVGQWIRRALVKTFGTEPVRIPMMGGTVPSEPLVSGLGAPIVLLPLVNADNDQHAANENMRLGNYLDGVRSLEALLTEAYDPRH